MSSVVANGVRLRYVREGAGDPVLLLHGFLFGADSWRPQIDALRDAFDVIAVDLRGQFGSETTADGYDLWNQARDMEELIEALGLGTVHLVGLSMGAMIGLRLTLQNPAAVRSLVLMDTTARTEDPELAERYEAMAQVAEADGLDAVLEALPAMSCSCAGSSATLWTMTSTTPSLTCRGCAAPVPPSCGRVVDSSPT